MTSELEPHILKRFEIKKRIGKGAYGIVWKAVNKKTKETVALKKIFDAFRNQTDAQRTFREISFLQDFGEHPNIISLYNVIRANSDKDIYLVFEYMETDLHNVIKKGNILRDVHKQYIMYQLFKATAYLHSAEVIHRDQKPSNVLLDSDCFVKLCDFGLARSLTGREKCHNGSSIHYKPAVPALTEYVATRWYRAPEILLACHDYTKGVDIWSLGCILGEMLTGSPLFPGSSTLDQIERIMAGLPRPSREDLASVKSPYSSSILEKASIKQRRPLDQILSNANKMALDMMNKMLHFNPHKRITAMEALKHPYVRRFYCPDEVILMSQHVVPPLDDNVQLSVSEYRNRLYQMIISKKMRMRARKRDLNEINKSTPSHGNSTNVMSTTSKTEPVTGVTVSSSHPGSRAGQSSVISAISVSVGVDRKPDRLRREHQASMRHHMNGTNGTRVKVTRNSADSPNNTRSEPLIQAIPETVTCKRGKSVQRRSFTPVASVVTEMDVENNRTELADSVNHTNGHGESTISNKPSYSSLADIQQLIEDRNEIESGNRAISFNGLDRISTVTTGKLLGHAFPSAYVGSMEQTTYERGLEASSSRANSAEACQSSSLILDKSMGSNRSKGQKHLMMGSNSTEIPTERQGNSPLTVMGPDRAPNFKSTSYIDIHQKSSRAAVNANRCASSLAGRRVAFEPISKTIRDASHSQPDELRTDSPLIFNTGSELSNVDYGNPYPGRSRTVMNHTNFSDWYTDECADRKNPLKPADDLDSRAGGIGQRGTQRIYPSRMLSSAYYPEKGSKENKSNSGQKNTASFDWNRSNQKSAYKYDANNHDLSEHSSGSVTNAHCFTSDVINVSSLGPPNDRTSTHHYQNSAHNEARSRVRVDPPAHVNATHSTAISNANTDLPSYGNYFRRNHNTNGEDRSHTTDANRLHFMSTPIIGSSTQPTNYQPDGGQSTNFLSSTQPTGVSELLPRSHPNGTLGQLLRDYQSRIRLASHNALTGNITVQGNRRGSETKMTAGLEASNGVRSLLESEYPSREEKNHFTANRLTTAGHPARGYSASRRLWSPLGHNAFSHTDPLVPVPASRNKSPLFERPLSRTSHQPGHDMIVSQTPILSRTAEKNGSTPSINMIPKHLRTNPTRSTIEPIHPSIYSQATSHDNRDSLSVNASRLRSSSRSATMIQSTVNPSSTVHKTNGTYGRMKSYTNHIQLPPAVAETRYRMKF